MAFLRDFLRGWRSETVAGVGVKVRRDDVKREVEYRHARDPDSFDKVGIFPRIRWPIGKAPEVFFYFMSGYLKGYTGFDEALFNADGSHQSWGRSPMIEQDRFNPKRTGYVLKIEAGPEWLPFLEAIPRAQVAVVRLAFERWEGFSGFEREANKDYVIKPWNKLLVGDMLKVYSTLASQALKDRSARGRSPGGTPPPRGSAAEADGSGEGGQVVSYGPFNFHPDGTVSAQEGRLKIQPGITLDQVRFDGYVLASTPSGGFIVVNQRGGEGFEVAFRGGRVVISPLDPDRKD